MKIFLCFNLLFSLPFMLSATQAVEFPATDAAADAQPAAASQAGGLVYVIPIRGIIEDGMLYAVERHFEAARRSGADSIVLHMDTPGGALQTTENLVRVMMALPDTIRTYTFVDPDALSAGSYIALATDAIYMAPQSRIGASAIVLPTGDIEEGDTKEKSYSAFMALMENVAAQKGYDPDLLSAMSRREFEYRIGDEVLAPVGRLLTLNEVSAARLVEGPNGQTKPLLSSGTVSSVEELLEAVGRSEARVVRPRLTPTEELVRWAKTFGFLFLVGGILGVYIEIRTPGFGIPGVLGLFCFLLFFWAQSIAGTAGTLEALVFIFGIGLLLLEIFVIPGFGIAGISGLTLMGLSVFAAMIRRMPGQTDWFTFPEAHLSEAVTRLGLAIVASGIGMALLARVFSSGPLFTHLALAQALNREAGYSAAEPTDALRGQQGRSGTPLRPSGIGVFNGKRLDVVARGEFIEIDTPIRIVETHGNRVVVESVPTQIASDAKIV
jgi:membrane-bound serine protease (ClpP class)